RLARVPRRMRHTGETPEVGPQRRDLAADRRRGEAEILEKVDELPQLHRGDLIRPPRALPRRVLGQPAHVAEITVHRMTAVPRLEREIVAELLQPKGWWGGYRFRRRQIHNAARMRRATATIPSTRLTRPRTRTTSSRLV